MSESELYPTIDPSHPAAKSKKGTLSGGLGRLLGAILLLMTVRWIIIEPYVIPSGSMIPTLLINDHIFANKFAFGIRWPFTKKWLIHFDLPERGDVVIFRSVEDDNFFMIKRVVGLPGDHISYSAEGLLTVNGEVLERKEISWGAEGGSFYPLRGEDIQGSSDQLKIFSESFALGEEHRTLQERDGLRWSMEELVVPKGHLFMMGDNRDNSRDSRVWGPLPVDNLLGRATFVWLSCTETLSQAPYLCNPSTIRWNRFFHWIQ